MRKFFVLFLMIPIINCSCPDGFELIAAGECRMKTPIDMEIHWYQATDTAISQCKAKHSANPVFIHNDEQQNYWNKKSRSGYGIPLGLVCDSSTKKWQWSDGSSLNYKPPSSSGYDPELDKKCKTGCGWTINNGLTDGHWYIDCDTFPTARYDIYCIVELQQPIPSGDGCNSFEDDKDDGVCYQVVSKASSWMDAQMVCLNLEANLASIHNSKENSFLRRLAVSKGVVDGIYLGATSSGKSNDYGWIDGTDWDYQNFYPGFPINGLGDCVAMDTQSTSGEWVNTDCSSNFSVACIRPRMGPPTCYAESWKEGQLVLMLEANKCCDNVIVYENSIGNNIIANLTGELNHQKYTTASSNIMRVSWKPNGGVNVQGLAFTFNAV